jgi:beta-mannanase
MAELTLEYGRPEKVDISVLYSSAGGSVIPIWRGKEIVLENSEQAWFWTKEWQAREDEADADIAGGRYETFDNMDDFIATLDE